MKATSIYEQQSSPERINLDGEKLQQGLAKLVLALVEVLRELLERQARRRVESGSLSMEEVERLGLAFMQIRERTKQIAEELGLEHEELDVSLGPLALRNGQQSPNVSLVDLIDGVIEQGAVVAGEVMISVADVDLITLNLLLMLSSVERSSRLRRRKNA